MQILHREGDEDIALMMVAKLVLQDKLPILVMKLPFKQSEETVLVDDQPSSNVPPPLIGDPEVYLYIFPPPDPTLKLSGDFFSFARLWCPDLPGLAKHCSTDGEQFSLRYLWGISPVLNTSIYSVIPFKSL